MKEDRHFFLSKDNSCWNSKFWWLKVRQSLIHSGAKPIRNCRHGKESDAEERQKKKSAGEGLHTWWGEGKKGDLSWPFSERHELTSVSSFILDTWGFMSQGNCFWFPIFLPTKRICFAIKKKGQYFVVACGTIMHFCLFFFNKIQSRDRDPTHRNWRKLYGTYSVKLN